MSGLIRGAAGLLVVVGALVPGGANASEARSRIVVFPFKGPEVSSAIAAEATSAAVSALAVALGPGRVLGPQSAGSKERVDLLEQALGCDYDVFCLVEVARLLQGDRVLLGRLDPSEDPEVLRLVLLDLDVARAALARTVSLSVLESEISDAAAGGALRLGARPDVRVEFRVEPPDAEVRFYGERQDVSGGPRDWWRGRWRVEARAPGFETMRRTLVFEPGPAVQVVELRLRPDPLYIPEPRPTEPGPFARASRVPASRVGFSDAVRIKEEAPGPNRLARPLPWVTIGVGLASLGVGVALAVDAQSQYADLAGQVRFRPGASASADVAQSQRGELRDRYTAGTVAAGSGVALAVLGLAWLVFFAPEARPQGAGP